MLVSGGKSQPLAVRSSPEALGRLPRTKLGQDVPKLVPFDPELSDTSGLRKVTFQSRDLQTPSPPRSISICCSEALFLSSVPPGLVAKGRLQKLMNLTFSQRSGRHAFKAIFWWRGLWAL